MWEFFGNAQFTQKFEWYMEECFFSKVAGCWSLLVSTENWVKFCYFTQCTRIWWREVSPKSDVVLLRKRLYHRSFFLDFAIFFRKGYSADHILAICGGASLSDPFLWTFFIIITEFSSCLKLMYIVLSRKASKMLSFILSFTWQKNLYQMFKFILLGFFSIKCTMINSFN